MDACSRLLLVYRILREKRTRRSSMVLIVGVAGLHLRDGWLTFFSTAPIFDRNIYRQPDLKRI